MNPSTELSHHEHSSFVDEPPPPTDSMANNADLEEEGLYVKSRVRETVKSNSRKKVSDTLCAGTGYTCERLMT
jgi:hypothetical protein